MTKPAALDERLVDGWFDELDRTDYRRLPANLLQVWRGALRDAVREAGEPVSQGVTGRFATLDRYLTGLAAGIAAAMATSPASAGHESDSVIFTAGLLAGSAAVQAGDAEYSEVVAARAAADAVVESASMGQPLRSVVVSAARAAQHLRPHALVSAALDALSRSISPRAPGERGDLYTVDALLDPIAPATELDAIALDAAIGSIASRCDWIPTSTGYRLVMQTEQPGRLIETVLSFGRVSDLTVRHDPL